MNRTLRHPPPVYGLVRRPLGRAALAVVALASLVAFAALTTGSVPVDRTRAGVTAGRDTGWRAVPPAWPVTGSVAGGNLLLPAPTRLRIPALGIDAPLEILRLDPTGALEVPRDFARPGWYADGTSPGDIGPAVIAGHVDSWRGPAIFSRLRELRAGDLVEVARGDRWIDFRVVATRQYAKTRFPTAEVYGPTPDPELRLITCGGGFDDSRRSYVDNVVTYAVAP